LAKFNASSAKPAQVFEHLEDHLDKDQLGEFKYDFLELKALVDCAWDGYKELHERRTL